MQSSRLQSTRSSRAAARARRNDDQMNTIGQANNNGGKATSISIVSSPSLGTRQSTRSSNCKKHGSFMSYGRAKGLCEKISKTSKQSPVVRCAVKVTPDEKKASKNGITPAAYNANIDPMKLDTASESTTTEGGDTTKGSSFDNPMNSTTFKHDKNDNVNQGKMTTVETPEEKLTKVLKRMEIMCVYTSRSLITGKAMVIEEYDCTQKQPNVEMKRVAEDTDAAQQRWKCDHCGVAVYDNYNECLEHEKKCEIKTDRLKKEVEELKRNEEEEETMTCSSNKGICSNTNGNNNTKAVVPAPMKSYSRFHWTCDHCQVAANASYNECLMHEKVCGKRSGGGASKKDATEPHTKKTAKKGISLARDASTAKSISVDKGPTKSTTTTTTAAAAQSTTNDNGKRPHQLSYDPLDEALELQGEQQIKRLRTKEALSKEAVEKRRAQSAHKRATKRNHYSLAFNAKD
ncbi:predicted protein [Thalassiosira pseudonana CCMP1335]|uniref:Uncharacterized protein n=1 Tax=Thalassiosira pseudonana TaxID=35128 RepID=B8CE89_THAPS|nr:predicted protein [Thalassiosira pseudonana CCMP1335]EED88229.1 predicted protein [Thalassiosira pseudonana CCMP1335]